MVEMGPAVRGLIESAAVTQIAEDAVQATLLLKRVSSGLRLLDLAPPEMRPEIEALMTAVRRRAEAQFTSWTESRGLPAVEVRNGLDVYERCAASELETVLRDLTPADTPRATLEAALREATDRYGVFRDDLIARDISWAMVKAAIHAAEGYAQPLRGLGLRPLG